MKFKKPCLICGALSYENRCPTHLAQYQARRAERYNTAERKEKKRILYGGDYKKRRQGAIQATSVCYLCKKIIEPTQAVDVDHVIAGDPTSPLLPTHARCNRSRGNRPL